MKKSVCLKLFVSLLFIIGATGILFIDTSYSNIKENDVIEYSAHIKGINKTDVNGILRYRISTKEYGYDLLIPELENLGLKISNISDDETIVFGVEKKYIDLLTSNKQIIPDMFVPIVSLKTENFVLFTLNDYNQNFKKIGTPARLSCIFVLIVSIVFFVRIYKKRKQSGDCSKPLKKSD